MKKQTWVIIGLIIIILIAVVSFMRPKAAAHNAAAPMIPAPTPSASSTPQLPAGVTLMTSTNVAFASSQEYSHAHEVFPTQSADAKKALSAYTVSSQALGGGAYNVTLENGAEGVKGQTLTVGPGQKVYFVEKSTGDDNPAEDSSTKDDYLVAVDAQGMILQ